MAGIASAPPYPIPTPYFTNAGDLPPGYEESTNPNSMPPSYESLFGEFRQVENPKSLAQFLAKATAFVVSTVTAAVLLAFLNIIPLFMVVLGSMNIHRCPIEPYIPVWLIITGVFSLFKSATNFYYRAKRHREGRPPSVSDINPNPFDGLLSCFLIVWFIIGSVWIYSIYDEVHYFYPEDSDYCDQFTYMFSFVFVTGGYILLALTCCCLCCCCCCICCRPKREAPQQLHP